MEEKIKIRQKYLKLRDNLNEKERIEYSIQACQLAIENSEIKKETENKKICSGFLPIKSEIDPRPLMSHLKNQGTQLCLPVVVGEGNIEFRIMGENTELINAGFGTIGPNENAEVVEPEMMIIPLSVYDRNGGRIGYGKGYYDRAIDRLMQKGKNPLLMGMAFKIQETKKVPMEIHDQNLHFIITQDEIIRTGKTI